MTYTFPSQNFALLGVLPHYVMAANPSIKQDYSDNYFSKCLYRLRINLIIVRDMK